MDATVIQTIRGYELREQIEVGGFGAVYRAYQTTVGREVAIKIILPGLANLPDFIRRFEAEAQLIARLEHPHIVPLHDYWRDPQGAYLVMRWLRGGSLRDALQNGPFDLRSAALLLDQVASALSLAHRNNVIHRDIKPGNILLDEDGNAYLSDFGIAKDLNLPTNTTQPDMIMGSLDYISPEQARSQPVTPRTDIYSLGVTIYEAITGHHPFQHVSAVERLYKHINDPLPQVTTLNGAAAVNQVIQKATAKNPDHRYADALAFAGDFREAAGLNQPSPSVVEQLTQREQEILTLIIEGLSNKEIAQRLTVTLSTVKWYIYHIYGKLGVRSRVQAMVRARELNLLARPSERVSITVIPTGDFQPDNPYKGLRAFQSADNQDFFGREKVTAKLVARLGETGEYARFLAVVGPSGSGKSSLVRAGLIPALWRGDLAGSEKWFIAEMLPGARPLDELEIALTKVAANQAGNLREHLTRDRYGLLRIANLILPGDGSDLVLIVDQFEEVFTLIEDEAERTHFLELLYAAVTEPRSRMQVIVTLRADFYDRPLHYPRFGEMVQCRLETILPLSADELERAIARPAERVGMTFEPGLVASIVSDVNYQPGALPLLQYALTELFQQRAGRRLTREAYQAIGGAVGALAKRAEDLYQELTPEGQEAARQMFLRLVTLGEGTEDTRRRAARAELLAVAADPDVMDEMIDTYASYRLLSLDIDPATRSPTVEVAHEALLREWKRLRGWLNDSREEIRLQRQLAAMAAEWYNANQDSSFLVQGARLEQFERFAQDTRLALTQMEHTYLKASLAERERQAAQERERLEREAKLERRAVTWLRALVIVFAFAATIAVGLTLFAFNERNNAQNNFIKAERTRLAAQAQIALNQGEDMRIPALLALRSLELGYSPEADAALLTALSRSASRQIYEGHTDGISTAVFSPDGRYVLSASVDGTARLWDTQTGVELRKFLGHFALVNRAIFTPDGQYVLTAGTDGTARQWDVATGEEVRLLLNQGSPVYALVISPDGRYIATSNDSNSAQLWDFENMELVREFIGHTDLINQLDFSPDGRYLATGSFDYTARLWNIATGGEVQRFEGHAGCACWVDFSPDGSLLVTAGSDSTARLWDVNTGEEMEEHRLTGHTVVSAEFSPDGQLVVTSGRTDLTIRLWDVETGQQLRRLIGHTSEIRYSTFSPDGRFVLSSSADNTVRLWDLSVESEPQIFQNPLATVHGNSVVMATLPADNRQIITANSSGMIQFWDVETGQIIHEFSTDNGGFISDAAPSRDGRFVVTPGGDGVARLWDAATGQRVRDYLGHTSPIITVEMSSDGEFMLTGAEDGSTILWEVASGEVRQRFEGHEGWIHGAAFSPDGRFIATASDDATARLWDARTGEELRQFVGQSGAIFSVAFSPDGNFLLTGGEDNTAHLWDAHTGQELKQFVGHILPVRAVAFSPDGGRVITASLDQTVRIWEWETDIPQVIRQFVGQESALRSLSMSSDGQFLLTGDLLQAYLWRVDIQEVIELACARLPEDFRADERARYAITDNRHVCGDQGTGSSLVENRWTPIPTHPIPVWTPLPPLNNQR